jgi:NAD+ diphosphatase
MLGFLARLDGDPAITLDPTEMADAGWFTRAEVAQAADWTDEEYEPDPDRRLRAIPPHFSISRYLIDKWLAGEV